MIKLNTIKGFLFDKNNKQQSLVIETYKLTDEDADKAVCAVLKIDDKVINTPDIENVGKWFERYHSVNKNSPAGKFIPEARLAAKDYHNIPDNVKLLSLVSQAQADNELAPQHEQVIDKLNKQIQGLKETIEASQSVIEAQKATIGELTTNLSTAMSANKVVVDDKAAPVIVKEQKTIKKPVKPS